MVFQWDKWSTLSHICLHLQGWTCCNYTVPVSLTALLCPIWFISILVKYRTKFIESSGAFGWFGTHANHIRTGLFWSHRLFSTVSLNIFLNEKTTTTKKVEDSSVLQIKISKKILSSGNIQLRMEKKKKKQLNMQLRFSISQSKMFSFAWFFDRGGSSVNFCL